MSAKAGLIAAALSAHLGVEIKSEQHAKSLTEQQLGQLKLVALPISTIFRHGHDSLTGDDSVSVKVLHRDDLEFSFDGSKIVKDIKKDLVTKVGLASIESLSLLFRGRPLADDQSVSAQNVFTGAKLSLVWGPGSDGPQPTYYIPDKDLAPQFDYDFTNITDAGKKFERGGYVYNRPCGWDRCALSVRGRYSDDVWLGENGIRTWSSPGEWAVSYHGTGVDNIGSISDGGYDSSKGKRAAHGKGIYSSPSVEVAKRETYAKTFTYGGKRYKVVLQNRVNMAETNVYDDSVTGAGVYYVTPDDKNIRPYGVCIKEV